MASNSISAARHTPIIGAEELAGISIGRVLIVNAAVSGSGGTIGLAKERHNAGAFDISRHHRVPADGIMDWFSPYGPVSADGQLDASPPPENQTETC
jgi:hypothetical protein